MDHMSNGSDSLSKHKPFSYFENQCSSRCFFKAKFLKLITKNTFCRHKIPILFQEPYILKGYRRVDMPWFYYLSSIFKLHNESVNIWSHILASLLVFKKFQHFSKQLDFINDPFTWPLLAGIISSVALFSISFSAHCLQSKSCIVHYVAFMLDYAGIGLYALGSTVMFLEYSSTDGFFHSSKMFFVPLGVLLSCASYAGCCLSKIIYDRPYPFARKLWQIIPIGGAYGLLISPVVHKLYLCFACSICTSTLYLHLCHIIWFIVSSLFFACQFPQSRASVGSCDLFFHSHQLFHTAIMISILIQLDAIYQDFSISQVSIRSRTNPTFISSFGPTIFVFAFEMISLLLFHNVVKMKLKPKTR